MERIELDHLNLTVAGLEETIGWYGRVFGFEVVERDVQDGVPWAVLRVADVMLCIYEHPDREQLDSAGLESRSIHGLNHFSLRIGDVKEWQAIVDRESLSILYGGIVEWPHSRSWYIKDPTGHEIEVAHWHDAKPDFEGRPRLQGSAA
jgi:catechol 2,3-dioxygenase-like lactoylglutathione lyase family enzyme